MWLEFCVRVWALRRVCCRLIVQYGEVRGTCDKWFWVFWPSILILRIVGLVLFLCCSGSWRLVDVCNPWIIVRNFFMGKVENVVGAGTIGRWRIFNNTFSLSSCRWPALLASKQEVMVSASVEGRTSPPMRKFSKFLLSALKRPRTRLNLEENRTFCICLCSF